MTAAMIGSTRTASRNRRDEREIREKLDASALTNVKDKLSHLASDMGHPGDLLNNVKARASHLASDVSHLAADATHKVAAAGSNLRGAPQHLLDDARDALANARSSVRSIGIGETLEDALSAQRDENGQCMGMKTLPAAIVATCAVLAMRALGMLGKHADLSRITHIVRGPIRNAIAPAKWYDFSDRLDQVKSRFQSNWSWFENLNRPAFAPSCAAHQAACHAMTACMAACGFRLLSKISRDRSGRNRALGLLGATLAAGALWAVFVVGFRSTGVALGYSMCFTALLAATCAACFRFDKLAGQLLLPALAWQSYLCVENAFMFAMNSN